MLKLLNKVPIECKSADFETFPRNWESGYKKVDCDKYKHIIHDLINDPASFEYWNSKEVRRGSEKIMGSVKEEKECNHVNLKVFRCNEVECWGEKVIVEYDKKDSEDTTIIRPTFDTNKIDGDYDYYSRFDGA